MEKVYAIFSGEYSDWNVHGFFTNEEDADKYCSFKNTENEYEDFYVIRLDNIEREVDLGNFKTSYLHEIDYRKQSFLNKQESFTVERIEPCNTKRENTISTNAYGMWFHIVLDEKNEEKAIKIAQDMLAKKKAEEQGL